MDQLDTNKHTYADSTAFIDSSSFFADTKIRKRRQNKLQANENGATTKATTTKTKANKDHMHGNIHRAIALFQPQSKERDALELN